MGVALPSEGFGVCIEIAKRELYFLLRRATIDKLLAEGGGISAVHRAKTSVTPPMKRRAQRAAAYLCNRTETECSAGDHHTHIPFEFALDANAVRRNVRFSFVEKRNDNFDELKFVDRTTAKLKIDMDKRTYGKRTVKR